MAGRCGGAGAVGNPAGPSHVPAARRREKHAQLPLPRRGGPRPGRSGREPPDPQAIIALGLDRLGLPHNGVRISRQGDTVYAGRPSCRAGVGGTAGARGGQPGGHRPGAEPAHHRPCHGPAGQSRRLRPAARRPRQYRGGGSRRPSARAEPGTPFGPAGSLFHTLQPGETLADVAQRHFADGPRRSPAARRQCRHPSAMPKARPRHRPPASRNKARTQAWHPPGLGAQPSGFIALSCQRRSSRC